MIWRSLRVKLVLVYTLLILFAVEMIGAYFVRALTNSLIHNQSVAAKSQAQLMATLVGPQIDHPTKQLSSSVTSVLQSVPQFLDGTVYLLNRDGYVMYTTAGGALVGQKRTDSEATQVLIHHQEAVDVRFDPTANEHVLVVAVPISQGGNFDGVLEYVTSIQTTYDTIRQVTSIFYTVSGLVLALTIVLGIVLSRALTRPVIEVTKQARVMAAGDFSKRVTPSSNDEFGDLVVAINHLADELDEALAMNRREQERLHAIITSMGDGVIVLDSDCRVLFMNHAARRMMGIHRDGEWDKVDVFDLDEMVEQAVTGDCMRIRVVGEAVYHIILTSVQRRGQTDGFVAVVRDVTEQEQLNQARREFVSNVSHELRTPLTSVKSYIEALRGLNEDERETRQAFLEVIEQETDRMVRLTRDLLQLSGLDRGQTYNVHQRISVSNLLAQVKQRFQLQAERQQLEFTVYEPDDEGTYIVGNRDMVNRILDNLISNAMKYTPAQGHITVCTRILRERIVVTVTDDGIGIPEADLPRVFERFYRVDKGRSRKLGGTGLGLALAREMVERLGGSIAMTSEPDRGTQVKVTFVRALEVQGEA
ncbi:cell wall metabolism sensor histidine kinase WalK [Alicyclobacillus fastidiosus]|uniref:histidine kinase n=2 Tax=Alicyclobacillus fastidiosus TaxID=392011 RepID=A0ABY6ZG98_9BACL|nr:ATP-binding protein [Alicyclobacillus fastidiosus]WAH41933.1 cell wall metabolism sensor histidine kinase WalK [Alicyclobacillus fastidiosus]